MVHGLQPWAFHRNTIPLREIDIGDQALHRPTSGSNSYAFNQVPSSLLSQMTDEFRESCCYPTPSSKHISAIYATIQNVAIALCEWKAESDQKFAAMEAESEQKFAALQAEIKALKREFPVVVSLIVYQFTLIYNFSSRYH